MSFKTKVTRVFNQSNTVQSTNEFIEISSTSPSLSLNEYKSMTTYITNI